MIRGRRSVWPIVAGVLVVLPVLYVLAYSGYTSAIANSEKLPDWV